VLVLSALVDDANALDPQAALDLPRFCIDVEESAGGSHWKTAYRKQQFRAWKSWGIPFILFLVMNARYLEEGK